MEFVLRVLVLTPSLVHFKGVGLNSIFCIDCAHWVLKCCHGLSSSLDNVVNFKCRTCLNPPVANDDKKN